jgi:nucleoid DNA-binding protein
MTKSDIVDQITQKTGIEKEEVSSAIEAFFRVIKNSLIDGEAVYVRGFGTFSIKKEALKQGVIFQKIPRSTFLNTVFPHLNLLKNLWKGSGRM